MQIRGTCDSVGWAKRGTPRAGPPESTLGFGGPAQAALAGPTLHSLRSLGFLVFALLCQAIVPAVAEELPKSLWTRKTGDDWPQLLGPKRDGKSRETGLISPWPATGPRVVWTKEVGTGYSVGSVAYGRIYQFDKIDDKATLTCLNAETGEKLWDFTYPSTYSDLYGYNDGPRCAPVIDGNRVYLFGVEGMLHCVNATSGKLIWKFDTEKEFGVIQNFFGVGSAPIVEGDLLLVMVGGSPERSKEVPPGQLDRVVPNGSAVVAFDKHTGKVRYKLGDDLASYAALQTATINNRRWAFAFCREGLLGFEPKSGKLDFHFPWRAKTLESVNASTPVVVGNQVLISETYGPGSALLEASPGKADVVWQDDARRRAKAMQTHWNTPVYHEGYLYGSSGRHAENAELRCIDWKTGKVQWSEPGLTRCTMIYVDGHFVVLSEYGTLMLIKANPEKFELVSEITLPGRDFGPALPGQRPSTLLKYPCWSAPVLSHGLLYVRGDDRLVCLEVMGKGQGVRD